MGAAALTVGLFFSVAALAAPSASAGTDFATNSPTSLTGNIFQVELRNCINLHVGYNRFPNGTVVNWNVSQNAIVVSHGKFTAIGGGVNGSKTYHFITQPLGVTLQPKPDGHAHFHWVINGTTFSYTAIRNPGCTRAPTTTTTQCSAGTACHSPTVTSSDGSTSLQVTADPSAGSSTLTVQVGGLAAMLCTLPGSGSVISQYHTTASDAGKIADYTVFGAAAAFAKAFYAAHPDISGCYGSPDEFNGWSPEPPSEENSGGTWANGPYVYGPAPFDPSTGLFEAFLGSCANHDGYQPCFVNINGEGSNTTEFHSPASTNDPRVSH